MILMHQHISICVSLDMKITHIYLGLNSLSFFNVSRKLFKDDLKCSGGSERLLTGLAFPCNIPVLHSKSFSLK